MRHFKRAIFVAAWLFSSALGEDHGHANVHQRRGLSDILDELEGALGPNSGELASLIEAGLNSASAVPQGGATTIILSELTGGNLGKATPQTSTGGIERTTRQELTTPAAAQPTTATASSQEQATSPSVPVETSPNTSTPGAGQLASISTTTIYQTQTIISTVTSGVNAPTGTIPAGVFPPNAAVPSGFLPPILQPGTGVLPPGSVIPSGGLPNFAQPTGAPASEAGSSLSSSSSSSATSSSASIPAGVAPTPLPAGMQAGVGQIVNGQCQCSCACPSGSFPPPAQALLPGGNLPISGTTLQTIILPPTSSAILPSSILIDTSIPPGLAPTNTQGKAIVAPTSVQSFSAPAPVSSLPTELPSVISTPEANPLTSTTSTILPPAQSVVAGPPIATSADSTIQLSLAPTPQPDLAAPTQAADAPINISTFSLVSSLVLNL